MLRSRAAIFVILSITQTVFGSANAYADQLRCPLAFPLVSARSTRFLNEVRSFSYADSLFRQRDYKYRIVEPDQNGSVLNQWAQRHFEDGGTKLGLIRLEDNVSKEQPSFGAGFEPKQNMLMLVEKENGVETFLYEHETRHKIFDNDIRQGRASLFIGFANQTFEEFYTYSHDIAGVSSAERLPIINYVEQKILPIRSGSAHSGVLKELSQKLGQVLASKSQLLPGRNYQEPTSGNFRPYMESQNGLWFIGGKPDDVAVLINQLTIHGRVFVGITMKLKDTTPISVVFSTKHGVQSYFDLIMGLAMRSWSGPEGHALLRGLISKVDHLSAMASEIETRFSNIRREVEHGRTGDAEAKLLAEAADRFRTLEQPAL